MESNRIVRKLSSTSLKNHFNFITEGHLEKPQANSSCQTMTIKGKEKISLIIPPDVHSKIQNAFHVFSEDKMSHVMNAVEL